ncbi:hypothetical protein L1887_53681 [Cichorium endivia]|nr:hypothetical protein L1887_53681 [Cichorium endivia]
MSGKQARSTHRSSDECRTLRQSVARGSSDQALLSASERLSTASRDAVELERSRRFVDSGSGAQTRLETPSHLDGHGLDRRGSVWEVESLEAGAGAAGGLPAPSRGLPMCAHVLDDIAKRDRRTQMRNRERRIFSNGSKKSASQPGPRLLDPAGRKRLEWRTALDFKARVADIEGKSNATPVEWKTLQRCRNSSSLSVDRTRLVRYISRSRQGCLSMESILRSKLKKATHTCCAGKGSRDDLARAGGRELKEESL